MNRWRFFAVACSVVCWTFTGAGAARWNLVRDGTLTVIGDQSPSTLADIATEITQFRAVVGGLIRNADRPLSVPTVLFVIGRRSDMLTLAPLYKGQPANIGGYTSSAEDANYIVMSLESRDESTRIIYHEYTHLLLRNAVRGLPLWLNEGLAEYYSSYRMIERGRAAIVGHASVEHLRLLRERHVSVAELLAVDRSSPMYNEGLRQSIFYAESWAITHYLMLVRPNGRAAIDRYLTEIAAGRPSIEAFTTAFGASPADFDKELLVYVRRLTFPAMQFDFAEKLTVERPSDGRPLTPAEVDAWTGDAQRRVGRKDEGAPRVEHAAAAEPNSASVQMALGLLRLSQYEPVEAIGAFSRASALAPDDFMIQYVSGMSETRADRGSLKDRRAETITVLKKAIALNSASSDAWAMLAFVQMISPETVRDAQVSIERAIALSPGRVDYLLRYADVRLLQGDVDEATRMLTSIAAVKTDASASRSASTRLQAIGSAATGIRLRPLKPGERRALGTLTNVECSQGRVRFTVEADGRTLVAVAPRFEDVEMQSFLASNDLEVSCGARTRADRVYLTWSPANAPDSGIAGRAIALEFVPSDQP